MQHSDTNTIGKDVSDDARIISKQKSIITNIVTNFIEFRKSLIILNKSVIFF